MKVEEKNSEEEQLKSQVESVEEEVAGIK